MQTETLEKTTAGIAPINETAELLDREIHRKTLAKINALAREYEIKNPELTAEFIGENLFLLDLLEEIPAQVRRFFGGETKLALEILSEPDFASSSEIFVLVFTKIGAKQARALMDEFDRQWWLENLDKANCKLNVSLEYV
jgi:hypothetical protein